MAASIAKSTSRLIRQLFKWLKRQPQTAPTGKNHKKVLPFWPRPSCYVVAPRVAQGLWADVPVRMAPTETAWGHHRTVPKGLSDSNQWVIAGYHPQHKSGKQLHTHGAGIGNSSFKHYLPHILYKLLWTATQAWMRVGNGGIWKPKKFLCIGETAYSTLDPFTDSIIKKRKIIQLWSWWTKTFSFVFPINLLPITTL